VKESFSSFLCVRMNCRLCHLIGYYASRLGKKMNIFIFRRSRIEAELKSNRSRIAILITLS